MTEAEMYRAAAGLLRRDGWCQGRYRNTIGKHCMLGACAEVSSYLFCIVAAHCPTLRLVTDTHIGTFNDAPDMTADDAIAALEIAADLAA